jgi:hypothetical protein
MVLGAIACLILADHRTSEDLLIGAIVLVLALGHAAVSHQSLASNNLNFFYGWGELLTALAGGVILFTFPWSLGFRLVLAALLGGLAVGLHRQHRLAGIIWQGIIVVGLALSLFLGYLALSYAPWPYWPLAFGSIGLCLLFAWRYRWRRSAGDESARSRVKDIAVPGIEDLLQRGKLYEILDLPPDHILLDLTASYAQKSGLYNGNNRAKGILKEAYDILMVKEDRELYRKSREVMEKVKRKYGGKKFHNVEAKIWKELWAELNTKYTLQPEKITNGVQDDLVNKYTRKY